MKKNLVNAVYFVIDLVAGIMLSVTIGSAIVALAAAMLWLIAS